MPHLSILLAVLLVHAVAAAATPVSFAEAVDAYERGDHAAARTAFARMAETGFIEAQFNLGVMLLNGLGGEADRIEAARWIRLAAEHDFQPAADAMRIVEGTLDERQHRRIDEGFADWQARYGRNALVKAHEPLACDSNCRDQEIEWEHSEGDRYQLFGKAVRIERLPPRYPREAADRGIMGVVKLGAWVTADGDIELPHVIFSDPQDIFDESAVHALSRWEFEWLEEAPDDLPRSIVQTIIFNLDDSDRPNGGATRRELREALEQAGDDLVAAHRAAWLADTLQIDVDSIDHEALVEVVYKAASAGIERAQLDLADRFYSGNGIRQNIDSAVFWLKQAAFEGSAHAQHELTRHPSRVDGDFVVDLRRAAARQGLLPAVLDEIREQLESDDAADEAWLAELVAQLPDEWRKHPHPLIRSAIDQAGG